MNTCKKKYKKIDKIFSRFFSILSSLANRIQKKEWNLHINGGKLAVTIHTQMSVLLCLANIYSIERSEKVQQAKQG